MKRKFKNFIMIVLIILMGVFSYFTMKDVQNANSNMNIEQKEPKDMEENKSLYYVWNGELYCLNTYNLSNTF